MLKIITNPNPILRKKAAGVTNPLAPDIQKLIPEMIKIMKASDGIGIAAPQVGESIQLIVVNTKDGPLVLFNPKIISKSFRKEDQEEGCLSVPGVFGIVKRHKKVKVNALDIKGKETKINAQGLFARVLQHEIDHINGILFIDKAARFIKNKQNEKSSL